MAYNNLSGEVLRFARKGSCLEMYEKAHYAYKKFASGKDVTKTNRLMYQGVMREVADRLPNVDFSGAADLKEMCDKDPYAFAAVHQSYSALAFAAIDREIAELYPGIMEVKNIDLGQEATFNIVHRNTVSPTKAGNSKRMQRVHQIDVTTVNLPTEAHAVTVGVNWYDVLCGRISPTKVLDYAVEAMIRDLSDEIAYAFDERISADVGGDYRLAASAPVNFDTVAEIVENVDARNGGRGNTVLVGQRRALGKLFPRLPDNVTIDIDRQRIETGIFPILGGIRSIMLRPIANDSAWGLKFSANKIYAVTADTNPVKVVRVGKPFKWHNMPTGAANMAETFTIWETRGVDVITNDMAGLVEIVER